MKQTSTKLFFFTSILLLSAIFSLFVYSFSQVDLNLTLTSNSLYQAFQKHLTYLGYFNRPLSTLIYIVTLISLLTSYLALMYQSKIGNTKLSNIFKLVLTISLILTFAYPAFSHDIFNYIFDTRILIHHHQNPWLHIAQDYPNDLWTRFMRWTHRTYPYGPAWIFTTVPFYLLGLGKFLLTLISYKLIGTLSYLLAVFSLYQILKYQKFKSPQFRLILFALNPLIIIESLVTAHLDITMAALMLFSIYLTLAKQKTSGLVVNLISGLTKYVSLSTTPFLLLFQRHKISFSQFIRYSLFGSYLLTLYVISQREVLPWYFITPFALTSLSKDKLFTQLMLAFTTSTLVRYIPYLYFGDYSQQVINSRNLLSLVFFILTFIVSHFFLNHLLKLTSTSTHKS